MQSQKLNRRQFLKSSALAAASASLWPALSGCKTTPQRTVHSRIRGANEDIRIAVVGFNGRGKDHLKGFSTTKGVRIVALCDVDKKVLDSEVAAFDKKNEKVTAYQDIRKLLEDPNVDAISIATPNHWHSLAAIWAVQSGHDVYVEKPVSHNVWEGRQVINAARKYGQIVQTGTQCRSSTGLREAIQWVREGNLGKIKLVRGLCYKRRASIGKTTGPQPVPASIDYDIWTGPAPMEPLRRSKLHYDWHWVWPTGNGDLGNQGIHQMDISRWFLGEQALSPRIISVGGRLGYEDDGTTPNTLIVMHEYAAAPLIFEVRGLPEKSGSEKMDNIHGAGVGVVVECEGGKLVMPSYTKVHVYDKDDKEIKSFDGSESHFANFIKAVRSRNPADLNADIQEGHLSSALCHTGNISYRLGKATQPDALRDAVKNNAALAESLGRMEDHLKVNLVDTAKTPLTLGEHLTMDPKTERFHGNSAANKMLTRHYRKPFVVPEKV